MSAKRPRNIGLGDLIHYRFPIMAIVSILHRVSGFILFLMIPAMLWVLSLSLSSTEGFARVAHGFACPSARFFVWVSLSALAYHLIAGIKHLFMDIGFFETKLGGKVGSIIVLLLAAIVIVHLGVRLW